MRPPGGALVIGEALVDVVRLPDGTIREHPGGSPANVAVALTRLERPTTLVTQFADDRRGVLLEERFDREGIRLAVQASATGRTSVADATLDADGHASYSFDIDWSIGSWTPGWLPLVAHTGSLAAVLQPGAASIVAVLGKLAGAATVTYDVNIRPAAMGERADVVEQVRAVTRHADVVKASDEDLHYLYPEHDASGAARELLALGPAAVVITRGEHGSSCVTAAGQVDVTAPEVEVADTIGAGDSFCAGVIDALWERDLLGGHARPALRALDLDTWREVLTHAANVAAVTVTRRGAEPPTRFELIMQGAR